MKAASRAPWDSIAVGLILFVTIITGLPLSVPIVFQARDLSRTIELLNGHFIFFGPEATGGGNLPGGLYYYLLAPAMAVSQSWKSSYVLMAGLAAIGFGCMWHFLARKLSRESAFISCFFLCSMSWLYSQFINFMNSSFSLIFVIFCLISTGLAFAAESKSAKYWWLGACVTIGAGVQIQFTIFFILLAAVFIQFNAARLGVIRLANKVFFSGLAAGAALILPYIIWKLAAIWGYPFGQIPPQYVGAAWNVFPSFLHNLFKIKAGWAGTVTLAQGSAGWWVIKTLIATPALVICLLYSFSWRATVPPFFASRKNDLALRLFTVWSICALFSLIPALGVFPYIARTRYLIPIFFSLAFAFGAYSQLLFQFNNSYRAKLIAALLFCIGALDLGIMLTNRWNWNYLVPAVFILTGVSTWKLKKYGPAVVLLSALGLCCGFRIHAIRGWSNYVALMSAQKFEDAARAIIAETGWSFAEARQRIFWINLRCETTPEYIYKELFEHSGAPRLYSGKQADGYFVIINQTGDLGSKSRYSPVERLLSYDLEPTLAEALQTSAIQLGGEKRFAWGALVPYFVKDLNSTPPFFQNLGEYYQAEIYQSGGPQNGIDRSAPGKTAFYFNDCAHQENYCRIRFDITSSKDPISQMRLLEVTIAGQVLSQTSPWVSPDWTQGIFNPYVEFKCTPTEAAPKRIRLASQIGYTPGSETSTVILNSFLAPYTRRLVLPCSMPIHLFSVGYERVDAFSMNSRVVLPGRQLTLIDF